MDSTSSMISILYELRNKYGTDARQRKCHAIAMLNTKKNFSKKMFLQYYDVLLFIKAYPDDKEMYELADNELMRLSALLHNNTRLKDALYDTGISNTESRGLFSLTLTLWLRGAYRQSVKLESVIADQKKCISILTCILGEVPTEILQEGYMKWEQWLMQLSNDKHEDLLDVLIKCFSATNLPAKAVDELWNDMGIVISVALKHNVPSLGTNAAPCRQHKYHTAINKYVSISNVLQVKPKLISTSNNQKADLIALARIVLASHQRETDPVTHATPENCRYYDMSNGVTILLVSLPPERRQPADSYIGYMAFKNGVPVAYGGGWILFDSCRIGVNVFPAYRGGESSYIFAQIITLYKQIFTVNRFSVDPYQIGKNNNEGIRSGAFWMYYRLGFRPMNKQLGALADIEYGKITTLKQYRSPSSVLKKLADSKPELITGNKKNVTRFDATDLSASALSLLQKNYNGDIKQQNEEISALTKHIKHVAERRITENWIKLLGTQKSRTLLKDPVMRELLRMKSSGDEWAYVHMLQKQTELKQLLQEAVINQ